MFKMIKSWSIEHPRRLRVYASIIALLVFVAVMVFCVGVISYAFPDKAEVLNVQEPQVTPYHTAEPIHVPTRVPEPTSYLTVDDTTSMVVYALSCEFEGGCKRPLWQSHEREVITGFVPSGALVAVYECFYPPVRNANELTEVDSEQPIIVNYNAYTLEGLWCEVVYVDSDGVTVKGMLQYWNLQSVALDLIPTLEATEESN